MTKIEIKHTFELPEDNSEVQILLNASNYYYQLSNIESTIRTHLKYGLHTEDTVKVLEDIRKLIDLGDY